MSEEAQVCARDDRSRVRLTRARVASNRKFYVSQHDSTLFIDALMS